MQANFVILCAVLMSSLATVSAAIERPNVLLIVSDDLATTLGCYHHPAAKTPHLDALAARGLRFERAYCQFPHCNPSRSSFLTGLRPGTTRVTDNSDVLYSNLPGVVTMPHHFRQNGYATARCGKIFHLGVPSGEESMDDPQGWDFGTPFKSELPFPPKRESVVKVNAGKKDGIGWQEIPGSDDDLVDGGHAMAAIRWLEQRDVGKPFFLAVGFHRPHLPLVAPAKYFDLYPFDEIKLPVEPEDDESDIPAPARNGAVPGYALSPSPEQRRATIRGYLATVSYMDAQAGRVLDALSRLGIAEETIVIFTSDHGWHLGEHGLWHKRSLFEESARVPLIVSVPKMKHGGQTTEGLVELIDLFPTLCDLTKIKPPGELQGKSLRLLIDDPKATLHNAAFTQARRGKNAEHWGRSVRTVRWRCTEWDGGQSGIELYDHATDPFEYTNLATDPQHAKTLAELRATLATQLPPLPPSK
jgi:uncharacterized sulfatase